MLRLDILTLIKAADPLGREEGPDRALSFPLPPPPPLLPPIRRGPSLSQQRRTSGWPPEERRDSHGAAEGNVSSRCSVRGPLTTRYPPRTSEILASGFAPYLSIKRAPTCGGAAQRRLPKEQRRCSRISKTVLELDSFIDFLVIDESAAGRKRLIGSGN